MNQYRFKKVIATVVTGVFIVFPILGDLGLVKLDLAQAQEVSFIDPQSYLVPTPKKQNEKVLVTLEKKELSQVIHEIEVKEEESTDEMMSQELKMSTQVHNSVVKYLLARDGEVRGGTYSIMVAKLHFLLSKENKHDSGKGHGDNGKAGGCLQYWEGTWDRMRNKMIKEGFATEIGTRYDCLMAIDTTAWALSKGYDKEWGPLLRQEIKL